MEIWIVVSLLAAAEISFFVWQISRNSNQNFTSQYPTANVISAERSNSLQSKAGASFMTPAELKVFFQLSECERLLVFPKVSSSSVFRFNEERAFRHKTPSSTETADFVLAAPESGAILAVIFLNRTDYEKVLLQRCAFRNGTKCFFLEPDNTDLDAAIDAVLEDVFGQI